jgi:ADP-heptose:LPS heptosyltransferase
MWKVFASLFKRHQAIQWDSFKRVLVIRHRFIGDTILLEPFLRALREALPPTVAIDVLVSKGSGELLEGHPAVDELVYFESAKQVLPHLKAKQYEACFVLKRSWSSVLLALKAGIPWRIGFDTEGRGGLLTHPIPYREGIHEADAFMDALSVFPPSPLRGGKQPSHSRSESSPLGRRGLGEETNGFLSQEKKSRTFSTMLGRGTHNAQPTSCFPHPNLLPKGEGTNPNRVVLVGDWSYLTETNPLPNDWQERLTQYKAEGRRCILWHAVASNEAKAWDPAHWHAFFDLLNAHQTELPPLAFFSVGSPAEKAYYQAFDAHFSAETPLHIACGELSLTQGMSLLHQLDATIGIDSGPLHMAGTAGHPILALFGPTDPQRWKPLSKAPVHVLQAGLPCQPCQLKVACDYEKRCLTHLSPERVFHAFARLLDWVDVHKGVTDV